MENKNQDPLRLPTHSRGLQGEKGALSPILEPASSVPLCLGSQFASMLGSVQEDENTVLSAPLYR